MGQRDGRHVNVHVQREKKIEVGPNGGKNK